MARSAIILPIALFFLALWLSPALAEQPLVQEGKKTVFQRVVSHPGAILYADEKKSTEKGKPRTFTSFYVYERKNGMLRVGVSSTKADGWIEPEKVTEWPQAITMVFTKQMGRNPVLFFRDRKSLEDLCNSDGISKIVDEYAALFKATNAPKPGDLPVVAAEPFGEQGQVAQKNFYLLPVLAVDDQFKEGGTQLLEVASIDPGIMEEKKEEKKKPASSRMKTGIVFLVDTTISMGPYIEQTKDVIKRIFDRLGESKAKEDVAVAVVAFRSNMEKSKGIEYTTKIISDFTTVTDREKMEAMLKDLEEAKASTHAFDEDSLAGVKEAVDSLKWDDIKARAMLLITDAGPLGADDKTGATGMSPEAMADYLKHRGIYLTVAHVLTPKGKKDHPYAEKSYMDLSRLSNNRSSYIAIDAPNAKKGAESFDKVADTMSKVYSALAERQALGQKARKPENHDVPANASPEEKAKYLAEMTGYAMQLQFTGDQKKTRAPQVVKAWVADADLASLEENPNAAPVPAVEPAVLLTKSQLSQLRDQLKRIIITAEESFLQDNANFNFYEQLISAAAQASRDPSSFSNEPGANLAQKGVLLEVLDGLPYKSQVLRMKPEDWSNMSTGQQQDFIKRLKGLLREYEHYDRENQLWEGFGSPNTNEWVFRVPLNMLP